MDDPHELREVIIGYLAVQQAEDFVPPWQDVFYLLLQYGATPEDAHLALIAFVEELLAERRLRMN